MRLLEHCVSEKNFWGKKKKFLGKTNLFTTFLEICEFWMLLMQIFFWFSAENIQKNERKNWEKRKNLNENFPWKSFFLWIRMVLNDFLKVVFGEYSQNQKKIFLKFKKKLLIFSFNLSRFFVFSGNLHVSKAFIVGNFWRRCEETVTKWKKVLMRVFLGKINDEQFACFFF